MDSNQFERERGITIASKYTSFQVCQSAWCMRLLCLCPSLQCGFCSSLLAGPAWQDASSLPASQPLFPAVSDNQAAHAGVGDGPCPVTGTGCLVTSPTPTPHPPSCVQFKGHTFNAVDTPGHADFGGEVER